MYHQTGGWLLLTFQTRLTGLIRMTFEQHTVHMTAHMTGHMTLVAVTFGQRLENKETGMKEGLGWFLKKHLGVKPPPKVVTSNNFLIKFDGLTASETEHG